MSAAASIRRAGPLQWEVSEAIASRAGSHQMPALSSQRCRPGTAAAEGCTSSAAAFLRPMGPRERYWCIADRSSVDMYTLRESGNGGLHRQYPQQPQITVLAAQDVPSCTVLRGV
jgi:hypothetical protein